MIKPTTHLFVCGAVPASNAQQCHCNREAALDLLEFLKHEVAEREMHGVMVTGCECVGLCEYSPVVMVYPEIAWYCGVDRQGASEILDIVHNTTVLKSVSGCAGCNR